MAEQNQIPENLPIGGSDIPSVKIQAPKEGLEGLKEMLSSVFSKGDKAARAALGPAARPVEGLLSLFDLRDIPNALSSAGKDLKSGVTEGDPKAMLAGVLGTALVGAENVPGGRVTSKVATRWFRGSNNPKELEGSFIKEKEGVLGGGGVYITPNKEYAERYAKEDIFGAPKEGGFVNELEVDFKNPLVVDITSDRPYPELELLKKLGIKEDKASDILEKALEEKGGLTNEVKNKVIKQGYDGIILRKDGEIQEALIYDTNNIKRIAGEVPLKRGGSVVERNPYNYTAKAI